jgi:DNA-binding GntR family transcriptional regulator
MRGTARCAPTTLGNAVYETILNALMEGRIRAGDRLIRDRLAADLASRLFRPRGIPQEHHRLLRGAE